MADNEQNVNKQNDLSVASNTYIQALDRYMYRSGKRRSPNAANFYIQTVDEFGTPYVYTIQGYKIVGVMLTVNPSSLSVNASKIVTRQQTMTGWTEFHWGEELDTITLTGSTAAFIWDGISSTMKSSIRPPLKQTSQELVDIYNEYQNIQDLGVIAPQGIGDQEGLAVTKRRDTPTYQEFRQLMQLMNANGVTFDIHGLVSERLYIQITYNYAQYRGYFESFDLTESAESPYRFTYNITFKSEKTMYSFMR